MFDPVSVVGFVGTTAGLISFIANTAEKLHDRKIEWQDCKELLAWYRAQYDTAHLQLKCWRDTWYPEGHPRPDSAYTYFWGIDGFKAVEERIKGIHSEDENIRKLLLCECIDMPETLQSSLESPRDNTYRTEWRGHLENLVRCRSSQPRPEHWMLRFCFALYKHSDIKTRIARLKEKVADLETFSKLTFWTLQGREDTGGEIVSGNLSKLYRVRAAVERLEQFLVTLGTDQSSQNQWALILGRPVLSESLISLEEDHVLTLEFLVEQQEIMDQIVNVVYIDCPLSEVELGDLKKLERLIPDHAGVTAPAIKAMKKFLEQTIREDELRKAGELVRANLAAELVDSLIICYGTPCTRDLCTCGVRATHLRDKDKFWSFRAVQTNHVHHCHDQAFQDRGFVLLAVALAELAVSAPINILQTSSGEFKFQVNGARGTKELKIADLLREISHRSCRPYRKAVEYCLEMDRKLMNREIRPEDFPRCMETISQPVRKFAEKVRQENEKLRQEPWFQSLEKRYRL